MDASTTDDIHFCSQGCKVSALATAAVFFTAQNSKSLNILMVLILFLLLTTAPFLLTRALFLLADGIIRTNGECWSEVREEHVTDRINRHPNSGGAALGIGYHWK